MKDDLFTYWYENGQKESEITFKNGEEISKKQWNEDGSVKEWLNEKTLSIIICIIFDLLGLWRGSRGRYNTTDCINSISNYESNSQWDC